jgi:hypothetical protein
MNQTDKLHLPYLYQTAHTPVKDNPAALHFFCRKPGLPRNCLEFQPLHPVRCRVGFRRKTSGAYTESIRHTYGGRVSTGPELMLILPALPR